MTPAVIAARQAQAMSGLAHLADIAVNALGQKDKVIASDASAALRRLLVEYQTRKPRLDARLVRDRRGARRAIRTSSRWRPIRSTDLAARRTWLEWKGLRQIREVFGAALATMPEMAHVVAIDTRYVGEAALGAGDREVLALTVKFMNTYLRAALNARDVRTAYNVLNQYRQLAESLLAARGAPGAWTQATLIEIAGHFKYYARLAHGIGLGFVTETAAYDLCALCEVASAAGAPATTRCWASSWRSTRSRRRRPRSGRCAACARRRRSWRRTTSCTATSARARRIHDDMAPRVARSPALDPRRDAGDHLEGLLGDRRPRHQLRLPLRRAEG